METDRHYLKVGAFVLGAALAALLFAVWLTGPHDKSKSTPYRIRFAESVSGLDVGGPVKFRGVAVGKVDSIVIDPTDTHLVRVDISVLKTTPIKADTVASLKLQGITGVVFVELSSGTSQLPDLPQRDGDDGQIPEIHAESSSINTILNVLPDILQKVSHIADQTDKIFNDANVISFNDIIHNSSEIVSDVHSIVQDSKGNIEHLTQNLARTSKQLDAFIAHTNAASGSEYQELYQMLNEMKKTSREISQLARSLKDDPSQIISPVQEKGIPAP